MSLSTSVLYKDLLQVKCYNDVDTLGADAASDVARYIARMLENKADLRIVFAAAPSQNTFLAHLLTCRQIDFSRIVAFHMDEYIGLPPNAPQGFGNFLRYRLFGKAAFRQVHYINGNAPCAEEECLRYTRLLTQAPIDIVCMGIGENGHIAFNDPPTADFRDLCHMKVVRLDAACRQQQVNDGCFPSLREVPSHAYTLTIPALSSAGALFCIVPGKNKARAVRDTLEGVIAESCPASILRRHNNAALYLDSGSSGLLQATDNCHVGDAQP